jgi:hypothetical protein
MPLAFKQAHGLEQLESAVGLVGIQPADGKAYVGYDVVAYLCFRNEIEPNRLRDAAELDSGDFRPVTLLDFQNPAWYR